MRFNDSQRQQGGESNLAASVNALDEVREVGALLAVHETLRMLEGPQSARVHETIEHLLMPETGPTLRRWDRRAKGDLDTAAVACRDNLHHLAGERLGAVQDNPHNPG